MTMTNERTGKRAWIPRLAALLGSLVVALLLAEVGIRLFTHTHAPILLRDPAVSVRHVRSFDGQHFSEEAGRLVPVRFNREGFRGADLPYEKPSGVRRVAVLGDSMVAALEV